MKKNIVCIFLAVFMLLYSVGAVYAADTEGFIGGMGKKFVRGVVNTFTGWVEIPVQIAKGYNKGFPGYENNKLGGAFIGIFTGVWHSLGRTFSGFRDMAGFWAADHRDNDNIGIPLDAEYAWEDGTPHDTTKPSFQEATIAPMGNKLVRGLGDTIFGFLELPGQIVKGVKLQAPDAGVGKGLWYWFSREIDGVYDAATFAVPNPNDTKALPYDEEWPWNALSENWK